MVSIDMHFRNGRVGLTPVEHSGHVANVLLDIGEEWVRRDNEAIGEVKCSLANSLLFASSADPLCVCVSVGRVDEVT